MVKNVEIFAPEDLEFDFSPLGLGTYTMPGDIPTGKVVKMWGMANKLQNGEVEQIDKLKDLICDLFEEKHSEEEIEELREKMGINVMYQIETAIQEHIMEAQGEEAKNLQNPEQTGK